jgi:hypothetical protein
METEGDPMSYIDELAASARGRDMPNFREGYDGPELTEEAYAAIFQLYMYAKQASDIFGFLDEEADADLDANAWWIARMADENPLCRACGEPIADHPFKTAAVQACPVKLP